ncbi:MAG: Dienelactone hydrolase family protein [Caulobacteraceae bacterium]|nr:Dienelactone hydrolase family protein [Caulobacteraceae bacterium]
MADDQTLADAAARETIPLWPDGPPSSLPPTPPETSLKAPMAGGPAITILRNVSTPSLTVFRPDPARANGVGVIVCPGGGWRILAWEHEGVDLCVWLAERGYAAFLLKYRLSATPEDPAAFARDSQAMAATLSRPLPAAKTPRSLDRVMNDPATRAAREAAAEDGRRAVAIVRERAGEFGVNPGRVGLIGFSAGAFLVVDVALDPGGPAPAFVAPIYGGETRGRPVRADAPPLFTAVAQDDRMLVSVVRGLCDDWFAADRPVECHLFARGGHGFGMSRRGQATDRWIELLEAWLTDQGFASAL